MNESWANYKRYVHKLLTGFETLAVADLKSTITQHAIDNFKCTISGKKGLQLISIFYLCVHRDRLGEEEMNKVLLTNIIRFYRDLTTDRAKSHVEDSEILWTGVFNREQFASKFFEPFLNATKKSYLEMIEGGWKDLPLPQYVEQM